MVREPAARVPPRTGLSLAFVDARTASGSRQAEVSANFLTEYSADSPRASAASTAVYGHPTDQAASSASSAASVASSGFYGGASSVSSQAAYASARVQKKLDDAKDYIFSTWDDNQLRTWLEEHDVVSTPAPTGRAALLNTVRGAYLKVTNPIYEAWSTSTMHEWLVEHGIAHPEPTARDKLVDLMKTNYYDAKDTAYSKWDESQMRDWLVSEGVMLVLFPTRAWC